MRLHRRLARASLRTLVWSALLVALGVVALLRTALGHQVVLNWLVDQVDGRVSGRVQVESLRSAGILRGARLVGVELRTPQGETFLTADSLEVSYNLRGLISGDLAFRRIRTWGVEMELAWSEGVEGSTLDRWMAPPRPRPPGAEPGSGPTLRFEDVRIMDGVFRIRRPSGGDPGGMVRILPDGGGTLALDLYLDSLRVPELVVAPGTSGGTTVELESASGRLHVLREAIPIRDLSADIRVAQGRLDGAVHRLELPQGTASGDVVVNLPRDSATVVTLDLAVRDLDGAELAWLAPAAPPFRGDTRLLGRIDRDGSSRWQVRDFRARWAGSTVTGNGGVRVRNGTSLDGMEIRFQDLPVAALAKYAEVTDGKPGVLSGNLRLSGTLDRLGVLGRVGHRSEDGALSTADLTGTVIRETDEARLSEMEIFLSPLDYPSLDPWIPGLPVAGSGTASIRLNGSPASGLRFETDLTQRGSLGGASHVLARGSVRLDPAGWRVDVQGDASPFELLALRDRRPDLPVQGAVSGSFRVSGRADSLGIRVDVRDGNGRADLRGTLDATDLTRPVSAEGAVEAFRLGAFLVPLGDRTVLTGDFRGVLEGRGVAMNGEGTVRIASSTLSGVPVDSILLRTRVGGGDLVLDTARASVGGFRVDGGGRLPLPEADRPAGVLSLSFASDSLMGLRPALLGTVVHARDTLQALDREILLLSGIDPDTLPLLADVTLTGSVRGTVELQGALDDFQGTADVSVLGFSYGETFVERAILALEGRNLPGDAAVLQLSLDTDSLHALDRDLARSRVRASLTRTGARAIAELVRNDREDYRIGGGVAVDGGTYRVDLDQADFRFDTLTYSLTSPARLAWNDSVLVVDDLQMVRSGPGGVRLWARGTLPQQGEVDFTAGASGVPLERITQVLQTEELALSGAVDLDLRVSGVARDPRIAGRFRGTGLAVGKVDADSALVTMDYASQVASLDVSAWRQGSEVLRGEGTVPVDLSLQRGVDRTLDRTMDFRARLDQMDVAPVLSLLEDLESVEGTLTGDFTVQGTLEDPRMEGHVTLSDAAWTVGALGVRQREVNGTFTLTENRTVAVNARATSGGRLDLSGEVFLSPLTNPGLDLLLRFQGFQAVDRRDVTGAISGDLRVDGSYTRPRVTGSLTVDQGVLFLEEFQRAVGVVDLTDPLFLGLVERETVAVPVNRPLLTGIRNPFLDSLRVQVDVSVPRDTWLRSSEMNVEIGGELDLTYDRPRRDLVLVGELLARRGQYNLLGRSFEVEGGTVSFIGIPGINPSLDIRAVAPIRRQEGGTLDIQAAVQGSLVDPRVTLSTEEAGLAQSDLVSYLIFGRPSSDITGTAAGTSAQLTSTAGATLASAGLGTLAAQLGALAAQGTSYIDYLSVSQVGDLGLAGGGVASSFSSTQVEVGWYFGGGDVFGVLVLRPLSGLGGTTPSPIGGARLEWQSSDQYHLEAFVEDRFLRRGAFGLSELGVGRSYSLGLALFREWGY